MRGAKGVIVSIVGGEDMRLMEVDEAASHIKELVDPDANIIWGSAFNNELEGRIRVSVVATGIEAEEASKPTSTTATASASAAPTKVFSFPGTRTNAAPAAPAAAAPAAPQPRAEAPQIGNDDEASDELLLDSDDILTSPVGAPPVPPPAAEQEVAAPVATKQTRDTGTLFERMSNIARGAGKVDGEPTPTIRREPLDIPRFLNRQNNQ
jgi:cell division protein FtsZ